MAIETDPAFRAEEDPEITTYPSDDGRLFAGGITFLAVEAFAYDNGMNLVIPTLAGVALGACIAKVIR